MQWETSVIYLTVSAFAQVVLQVRIHNEVVAFVAAPVSAWPSFASIAKLDLYCGTCWPLLAVKQRIPN